MQASLKALLHMPKYSESQHTHTHINMKCACALQITAAWRKGALLEFSECKALFPAMKE